MSQEPNLGIALPQRADCRAMLDAAKPATLLSLVPDDAPAALAVYRAEALLELDRVQEARAYLHPFVGQLEGDAFSAAERCWAQVLLRQGWFDGGILAAESAERAARRDDLRAAALALAAVGFAYKRCWNLAEDRLRRALELDPNNPHVLIAQARMRLEADQRIEARKVYERLARLGAVWMLAYAHWGLSHVAYLLGEFGQARQLGETALGYSAEIVLPLYVLGQVALAQQDVLYLEGITAELEQRSPQAEGLPGLKGELEKLRQRLAAASDPHAPPCRRLDAFPTLVQRRDYCGPSTVELVLRYWRDGFDLTNDQIAESVKFPHSGTPIYRMREFFHLVGFDTVRPLAPVEKLKKLIDAGYPVITQEEFSNSSHVAVVIGYDDLNGAIELQDPMTHIVTSTPYDEFDRLRRSYLKSAVVAFPRGQGHDKALARLNLFDNQVVIWTDQAVLEMDQNRPEAAAELMQRAVKRLPAHALSWIMLLHAEMERWRAARQHMAYPAGTLAAQLSRKSGEDPTRARQRFYKTLEQARKFHPQAEFIYSFDGSAALLETDVPRALAVFQRACKLDPNDARNYASIAECHYALRAYDKALDAAWKALQYDQSLPAANAWVARCLAAQAGEHTAHYAAVAVELAPDWWLAHLALAEAHHQAHEYEAARRAVELALALVPGNPESLVLRAELLSLPGSPTNDPASAVLDAQAALENPLPLTLSTAYKAHQLLCRLMFGAGLFEEAGEQAKRLLALPGADSQDPWGLQFALAAQCETWLQDASAGQAAGGAILDETAQADFHQRYEQAVQANKGEIWVARDYLEYCSRLVTASAAAAAAARLRQMYPDSGGLVYLHGLYQSRSGQGKAAAQTMLTALSLADGVRNRDELYEIFSIVLNGLGFEAGEQALLDAPIHDGSAPAAERRRALGLALAQGTGPNGQGLQPSEPRAERARQLLRGVLEQPDASADDAYAWLRLGDVVESIEEQESCYRRALRHAPHWDYARANLARFLVHQARYNEALEFTAGYESQSQDILITHGQALIGVGYYEEAAGVFTRAVQQAGQPWSGLYYDKWYAEMECGWHEAALQTARQAHHLFPEESRWYLWKAQSLRELGRLEQAWRTLEAGKQNGLEEMDVLRAQFDLAWQEKDEQSAWSIMEQALELESVSGAAAVAGTDPGHLSWAEDKLLTLSLENGRTEDARVLLASKNLTAAGWGDAAWSAMLTEAHAFTLELAEHTLALDPQSYTGLYTRAQVLSELGQDEQALQALLALRTAHPDEHNAYEKLALHTAVDDQLEDALELADQAVLLGPFCPFSWAARGYVYFVLGKPVEAQSDLQIAWNRADSQRRHKSPIYWWLLGELQEDTALAEEMRQQTLEKSETELDRRMIAQVEAAITAGRIEDA